MKKPKNLISKDRQFLIDNGIIGKSIENKSVTKPNSSKESEYQLSLNHWLRTKGLYDGVPQQEILNHFKKYKSSLSSRVDRKDEKNYPG